MAQSRVQVLEEVSKDYLPKGQLYLQWARYIYENGDIKEGFRFIWRRDGNLRPDRGQARIPSLAVAIELIGKAMEAGWGHKIGTFPLTDEVDE